MGTRIETFRIAFAAHDEAACTHAAGNDPEITFAGTDCSFSRDPDIGAVVVFMSHVVVVAIHHLARNLKPW